MASFRPRRVGDLIRAELATLLLRDVRDPDVSHVSITEVKVAPDLRLATVYFTVFPDSAADWKAATAALERARGFLRREIGQRIRFRAVPELRFLADRSIAYAAHIESVLAEVNKPAESTESEEE